MGRHSVRFSRLRWDALKGCACQKHQDPSQAYVNLFLFKRARGILPPHIIIIGKTKKTKTTKASRCCICAY